ELIEPDRNDLRLCVPRNHFITALQTQQCPPSFQLALWEHTHDLAIGDSFRGGAHRRVRLATTDWDTTERLQDRIQNGFVIILLVDDVADRARTGELQDESVHPTDMIGDEKKAASRQVFQTQRSDAIKRVHQ